MSVASLLILFAIPGLLLLVVVVCTVRTLCQRRQQALPDLSSYAWRYPGTVRGGLVYCHHCHCSRLLSRGHGCGRQLHYCSLCGTPLFLS